MDIRIDLSGFSNLFATPQESDLADERIVDLLVRNFVEHALASFQLALDGRRDLDEVTEEINQLATAYNRVFLGTATIENLRIHPWNSAEQLGAFLRDTVELDYPPEDAVRASLIQLATQVMLCVQKNGDAWRSGVETMIGEVRDLLLGRLPPTYDKAAGPLPFA